MRNSARNLVVAAILILPALVVAGESVAVFVDTSYPGAGISPNAIGLSYETSLMLPDTKGFHYFRPDNKPLVAVFKMLGIKSLRIDGNSVDAPNVPAPTEEDAKMLFEFARTAGVKVICSVRLEELLGSQGLTNTDLTATPGCIANCQSAARFAKLIHDHYADALECFAIANEPDYFRDYGIYSVKWKAIHDAIAAAYPGAEFCGPDQNPSPDLDKNMARDFANASNNLKMITQHSYPFGCAYKNPQARNDITKLIPFDAADSRDKMLSPAAYRGYNGIHRGIASAITNTSLSYRLTEANSFWFSGLKGTSDGYASVLWSVDYLYWWTGHGADGINFHTGDRTGGDLSMICRYAPFVSSGSGYEVRPLGYGLKLFDLGGHGRRIPTIASTETNLLAFATLENKTVAVTLIHKAHGTDAREQAVQIRLDAQLVNSTPQIIFLRARNDDIAGGSADVSLGGASISEDGAWNGKRFGIRQSARMSSPSRCRPQARRC